MTMSYTAGLAEVLNAARDQQNSLQDWKTNVPLQDAIGGTTAEDILSPRSIPEHVTSAMDGYAIYSGVTSKASPETPIMFKGYGHRGCG
jgi:molybdopterin molybdotransferase